MRKPAHPATPSSKSPGAPPAGLLSEGALKVSAEKYALILEKIQDGYYEVDLEGRFTFFNDGLRRITGYSRKEMLGMNYRRIVDEYNREKVLGMFNQVRLTGVPAYAFDWECVRKDGSRRYVEVSVTLRKDADETPNGFMGIARDITERKLAEQALKESEARYRMIIENIQDGYYEVDLDGTYTFFNDGLLRITGYPREEMLGMNNRKIVDEYNNKKVFGTFHQVYLTGVPAHAFDWECIRKDGSRRYVEVSVSLRRDIYGRAVGFMGIARDITERKKYQTELEAKENELRQKNKSLEEANTALNVLMKKMGEQSSTDQESLRDRISRIAIPNLEKARENIKDRVSQSHLRRLEESLHAILSPAPHRPSPEIHSLTSTEIDVANLIVQGRRTKEIADLLNVTPKAIEVHRNNLRRKLGLTNRKTGLRAHLLSLR